MTPTLHLFYGKPASGKSSLAAALAAEPGHVLISEDAWLGPLFGDRMDSLAAYVESAARLRTVMQPHVTALLRAGASVVLDFPANTPDTRLWMREIVTETGCAHHLHLLQASDALCLSRLHARNAAGDHPFALTDAQFARITAAMVPPDASEGFALAHHPQA